MTMTTGRTINRFSHGPVKLLAAVLMLQWLCLGSLFCAGGICPLTAAHGLSTSCCLQASPGGTGAPALHTAPGRHAGQHCCEENTCALPVQTAGTPTDQVRANLFALIPAASCPQPDLPQRYLSMAARPRSLLAIPIFLLNQSFLC
ncbi:MAG: hypothetical protein HUN04_25155 [Desulfobacter sp.]|nr:MAG: hypothetical protein HUN04_25155 [Desulfobacter sp.]